MALWQGRSKRKPSGGRLRRHRKKRKFEISRENQMALIGPRKVKQYTTRGGRNMKVRVLMEENCILSDPSSGKAEIVKIRNVVDNDANKQWVRRNIITKGAIIETKAGNARITSRPGQHGAIHAVLIK